MNSAVKNFFNSLKLTIKNFRKFFIAEFIEKKFRHFLLLNSLKKIFEKIFTTDFIENNFENF